MKTNVSITQNFELPKEEGVHYRFLCLTGEDKGKSYFLTGERVVLGRGDNVDIKLNDSKSSREHAELVSISGDYVLSDLGSQNGVIVNDLKVKQHKLNDGDKVIIGKTVFKYSKHLVKKHSKKEEEVPPHLKLVREDKKQNISVKKEGPVRKIIIVAFVILAALMLFDEDSSQKTGKRVSNKPKYLLNEVSDEFDRALRQRQMDQDKELQKKLKTIIQRGLREFREGNYYRAINQFNLALILSPKDSEADYYLRKTKDTLSKIIEEHFVRGRKDYDALRYRSALMNFCSIVRLLNTNPEDKRYKDAVENIKLIEVKLGMEEGETRCIQK